MGVWERGRRGDGETGRLGDWGINWWWELGTIVKIGNTKLFMPTLAHLWKSNFVRILSINDLR